MGLRRQITSRKLLMLCPSFKKLHNLQWT